VANVFFRPTAMCQLISGATANFTGVVREPDGTMLRLEQGKATCTFTGKKSQIVLCGQTQLQPDPNTQAVVDCTGDPQLLVNIYLGGLTLGGAGVPASGGIRMEASWEFGCDASSCAGEPTRGACDFSATDRAVLQRQARQMQVHYPATLPCPPTESSSGTTSGTTTATSASSTTSSSTTSTTALP
jgi:hypothetical protein